MTRQVISTGTAANDGTGDTLRSAGTKINANFSELYTRLGGDTLGSVFFEDSSVAFEGNTPDDHETRLRAIEPTQDNFLYLPNVSGNVVVDSATQTLTNKTLTQPYLDSATVDRLLIEDIDKSHQYNLVPGNISGDRNINIPNLTDSDTLTFNNATQTIFNKTFYKPRIQQLINDSNGEPMLEFVATGTNTHVKFDNADNPVISTISANTNASLNIEPKGTGSVIIKKAAVGATASKITSGGGTAGSPLTADTGVTLIRNAKATDLHLRIDDGTSLGELKMVTNRTTGSGDVIIQFTAGSFAQGTTLTLEPNGVAQFVWDGDEWFLVNYFDTYMTIA